MREDGLVDVVLDFGNAFVFGVDRINTYSVKDDTKFFDNGSSDASRDLVELGDGESVVYFNVDGTKVFVGTVIGEDEVEGALDVWVFFDFFFDFAR